MSDQDISSSPVISGGLTTSDEIGELAKALAAARKDYKPVLKGTTNPFFNKKYADLAEVIEATSDALSKNGLVVIQSPRLGLNRIAVTTLLAHSSGQWLRDDLELPLSKFDAQGAGSAITYARRYAYQAIVGVAAEDDDGNAASQKFEKQGDNFVRKTNNNVPSLAGPPVVGTFAGKNPKSVNELLGKEKKQGRPKKESVPDAGKPWGGEFEPKTDASANINEITGPKPVANIHGLDIKDEEIPFPGDDAKPEIAKEVPRLATETERKAFMDRLIVLKNKGFSGIREYLLKESGETITNNIPFARMEELVARMEAAEKDGSLKGLLG